jgi:hypothetical protein
MANIPKAFGLKIQNQKIIVSIDKPGILKFKVYNVSGAQVMNGNKSVETGNYSNPLNFKSGIYLIKLEHEEQIILKRFLVVQ